MQGFDMAVTEMRGAPSSDLTALDGDQRLPLAHDSRAWWWSVCFVLGVCVLRVAYLYLLSPWDLVADEAHYWEWSRRPDWSYYTKGPGVSWVIWLSTWLFGTSAASVRLPAALAAMVMTLVGARLAYEITSRSGRAALYAALALTIAPGYLATAQLLTTDIFYSTGWLLAVWLVFHAVRPQARPSARVAAWAMAGVVIGVAFLFKYTALFILPGIGLFLWIARRRIAWDRATWLGLLLGAVGLAAAASPVLIWNVRHGWPTVAHQLGRVHLPGGDESVSWSWSPLWPLEYIGAQLGLLGVVGAVLAVLALRWSARTRAATVDTGAHDRTLTLGLLLLRWASAPLLCFYLALCMIKEAQGNWAIAGYTTLLTLAGIAAPHAIDRYRAVVATWLAQPEPRPKQGLFRRRPETPFQVAWNWYVGVGIVTAVVLLIGPWFTRIPVVRDIDAMQRVERRITGAAARAAEIDDLRRRFTDAAGRPPLVISSGYQQASLLAFYLPGRPVTYSANSYLGARKNAYDFFADTDLRDPRLRGRDVLLIEGSPERWETAFRFDSIEPVESLPGVYHGKGFGGPRTD
jgi:4-amino-4-deoxy-L-arabinose transferase-like glycosyltransferase